MDVATIVNSRKSWKTIKGKDEVVWPPHLEAALVEGLERYRPGNTTGALGRFPMRNRFISDYIFEVTGKRRTPKQVGSRIQQLRDTCEGKRIPKLLSNRPSDSTIDEESPTAVDVATNATLLFAPVCNRVTIEVLPADAYWPSDDIGTVPSPLTSTSASASTASGFPPGNTPRPLRAIDPTVTFSCASPVNAYSSFRVLRDGICIHAEDSELEMRSSSCMPAQQWPSGTEGVCYYITMLVPNLWHSLCEKNDLDAYCIVQNIIRTAPVNEGDASSAFSSEVIISVVYNFKTFSSNSPYSPPHSPASIVSTPGGNGDADDLSYSFESTPELTGGSGEFPTTLHEASRQAGYSYSQQEPSPLNAPTDVSGDTDLSYVAKSSSFRNFDSPRDRRIQALLRLILISHEPQDTMLGLVNDDAQHALDAIVELLDEPSFGHWEDSTRVDAHTISHRLRRLLLKLVLRCNKLPRSLFLHGIRPLTDNFGGFGGFSDIFLGSYGTQRVAIKRLRVFEAIVDSKRPATKHAFYHEAITWRTLSHRHILPFLGIDDQLYSPALCMVSPWMEYGAIISAIDRLKTGSHFTSAMLFIRVQKWIREIVVGLAFLHWENVVHGDLRCANILIDSDLEVKLADFGLSVFADGVAYNYASTRAGATKWLAPEIIAPEDFGKTSSRPTFQSDIYSFACALIELYTGNAAFTGLSDISVIRHVMSGKRPERPHFHDGDAMSDSLWSLLNECWSQQPSDRPTADSVVQRLSAV